MDDRTASTHARLIAWKAHNGWSLNQIVTGLSMGMGASFGGRTISTFVNEGIATPQTVDRIAKFLNAYPAPGAFENWRTRFLAEAHRKAMDSADAIVARREAVERERELRRRRLLAQERAAFHRPKAANDDFRLDAATVRALSGGTMRSLRHG